MPVCLHPDSSGHELLKRKNGFLGKSPLEFHESATGCIDIGLLNNMPDAALEATERQFLTLLDSAAPGIVVRLSLYSLPDIPRTEPGRRHIDSFYSGIESLWDANLDGLIVTGTEPRARNLMEEPYWRSLTGVLDWADRSTHSTILSCLGAHAAVRHFDGIERQRLSEKCFGLFESSLVANHPLTAHAPPRFRLPHSRWNGISEKELSGCGYRILARAKDAGVDIFVKQKRSLFVFFQGHPEYESNSLLLEYRRDVGRYLRREMDSYPPLPHTYFDAATESNLTAFRERVLHERSGVLLPDLPTTRVETGSTNSWGPAAARIWGNWLTCLCAQKERRRALVSLSNSA